MTNSLYPKEDLVPITEITEQNVRQLRIGEDFVDLARLGMIGEYTKVEASELCPRLYYRWNFQYGKWEVYACERDLIIYNLLGVNELKKGSSPSPEPGPESGPEPGPDPEPTPTPDLYKVKLSSSDKNWNFDGAIITFEGPIKWYPKRKGHYVPVTFKIGSDYLQYMDTLVVTYRGAKYDKSIFDGAKAVIYISVRVPGQLVPIRFDFTDDIHAQYFIRIDNDAKFQIPYEEGQEPSGDYIPDRPDECEDSGSDDSDGMINT
jgi:hypothetical protein